MSKTKSQKRKSRKRRSGKTRLLKALHKAESIALGDGKTQLFRDLRKKSLQVAHSSR